MLWCVKWEKCECLNSWPRLISLSHESSHSFLFLSIITAQTLEIAPLVSLLFFPPSWVVHAIQCWGERKWSKEKKVHMCHVEFFSRRFCYSCDTHFGESNSISVDVVAWIVSFCVSVIVDIIEFWAGRRKISIFAHPLALLSSSVTRQTWQMPLDARNTLCQHS